MLFENNNYLNSNEDLELYNFLTNNYFNNSSDLSNLYDVKEGFLRGNMFKNEYLPYKNLTYLNIVSNSEKEKLLMRIYEYDFALNDLNLYLDLHPEDEKIYKLFQKYVAEFEAAKSEYESKYGPLTLTDTDYSNYMWYKNPWPWDKTGGTYYV